MKSQKLIIENIGLLAGIASEGTLRKNGSDMRSFDQLKDAWICVEGDKIISFGNNGDDQHQILKKEASETIDAKGETVMPCWCDCHTHIVFAAWREQEFNDRLHGMTYQEIAARGGGILNSAKRLNETSEKDLLQFAQERLNSMIQNGTAAVEIKSGYGLSLESELKMLRIIHQLKNGNAKVKSTFLGAHAVPLSFKDNKSGYIKHIIEEMLPAIAAEKLADYCDVFCEENYFTKKETIQILEAAARYGIQPKVHAEQLSHSGGIEAGVECNAVSVDHLEYCIVNDISLLSKSKTIPVILPGAQFFLSLKNPPVREMLNANLPVAIATDFNPGSSPSGNMHLMTSIACINYKMTAEEALNAATINSAAAMNVSDELGSITKGKKASFIFMKEIPSLSFIPYAFGSNLTSRVMMNGKFI